MEKGALHHADGSEELLVESSTLSGVAFQSGGGKVVELAGGRGELGLQRYRRQWQPNPGLLDSLLNSGRRAEETHCCWLQSTQVREQTLPCPEETLAVS